jgi:hypothetical protein
MITRYETEGVIYPAERLQALVDALEIPVAKLFEHAAEPSDPKTDLTGIDAEREETAGHPFPADRGP